MKKWLAFVLCLVALLGLSLTDNEIMRYVSAESVSEKKATKELKIGEETEVQITTPGQQVMFTFTPDKTGYYTFHTTTGNDTYNVIRSLYLYDANMNYITNQSSWGEVRLNVQLASGEKYYFGATIEDQTTGAYNVQLDHFSGLISAAAKNDQSSFTVNEGDIVTLEVVTETIGENVELSYRWYKIEYGYQSSHLYDLGANSTSLKTDPANASSTGYMCQVRDQFGNNTDVRFFVNIENYMDNNLQVERVSDYGMSIDARASTTLIASWSCNDTEGMSYQWSYSRDWNGEWEQLTEWIAIDPENGNQISWTVEGKNAKSGYYRCSVKDRHYGCKYVDFYISIYNQFSLALSDQENWSEVGDQYNHYYSRSVDLNTSVQMEVVASAFDSSAAYTYTYRWYRYVKDVYYGYWYSELIEDATTAAISVGPVTEGARFECGVMNNLGSTEWIYLELSVDNLSGKPAGPNIYVVPSGSSETLRFDVTQRYDGELTYQWNGNVSTGRDTASCTTAPLTDQVNEFSVIVRDHYNPFKYIGWNYFLHVKNPSDALPLTLGETTAATISQQGGLAFFSFTPETSGQYIFESVGDSSGNIDHSGVIYDPDLKILAVAKDLSNGYFSKTVKLEAGKTYYFSANYRNHRVLGTMNIQLRQIPEAEISWQEPTYEFNNALTKVTATRRCNTAGIGKETETVDVIERRVVTSPEWNSPGEGVCVSDNFTNPAFTQQTLTTEIPALSTMDTLMLPSDLTRIEKEAFAGANCEAVVIPASCTYVGKKAFANCAALRYVYIPAGTTVEDNAFSGCRKLVWVDRQKNPATPTDMSF